MNKTIHGEFMSMEGYESFMPLPGTVTIDEEGTTINFDVGGIGMEELEDGIDFEFKGDDKEYYYNE